MHFTASTIIVAGIVAGQAAATGWRLDAHKYSSPSNTNNECSTEQKTGYSWDGLEPGSFSSYGKNKFSGFKCGNSFGKRDGLSKRTFQSKCITAEIDKEPKIECDGKEQMSIDTYEVSSDWDTDIDAHYDMPDGSTCKQTHRCTKGGNIVKNTQCGGAKKVTFKPKRGESGKNEKGESCNIGIHSIGFNCDKPSYTPPAYTAPTTSSAPAYTTSASEYTSDIVSTSEISSYESSSQVETTSSTEVSPETTTSLPLFSSYANASSTYPVDSTTAIPSTYVDTTSSEVSPESSVPAYESSPSSSKVISETTAPVYEPSSSSTEDSPETTAPAYETSKSSSEVVPETTAPAYEGSTSSVVSPGSNSTAPVYSSTTSSDAEVPSETYEASTPDTPDLLPKCLNTWVWNTECKDNSDYACYCKNNDLVKKVMECIEAWSDDDEKTQAAAGYLQGICAPYVPENPAIITACPSSGKPAETPVSESSPSTEKPEETAPVYEPSSSTEVSPITSGPVEMTTSTVYSTAVSTITSCAGDVEDCPAASQATAYVTETVAVSTTVCPVSEAETTKPETSKPSTEGSPEQSSSKPVESEPFPTQPTEPSTITYYSTSAVTVTSCAADVADCPASSTVVSETQIPVSYSVVETHEPSSPASPEQSSPASPEQSAPISEAPPAPNGEAPAPYTSEIPAATSPAPTAPAATGPSTTITYSSSVEVPATYSTGESLGMEIPDSKTYITIDTTITVPQVVFTTSTISVPGAEPTTSVGLAAGSPSDAPAYPTPTADSVGGSKGAAGSSGFGTTYVPGPTDSPITPYEGSASVARTGFAGVAIGALAAIFVL